MLLLLDTPRGQDLGGTRWQPQHTDLSSRPKFSYVDISNLALPEWSQRCLNSCILL